MSNTENKKESMLVQTTNFILEQAGLNPNDVKIVEDKKMRTAVVEYLGSGSSVSIRGKDNIEVREKKLRAFALPIVQRIKELEAEKYAMKEAINSNYGESINRPSPDPLNEQELKDAKEKMGKLLKNSPGMVYTDTDSVVVKKPKEDVYVSPADEALVESKESLKGHFYRGTQKIKEGDLEFDIILTEKDGEKYFTCPCGQTYDQKGHCKWNHIKRHLNKKNKKAE